MEIKNRHCERFPGLSVVHKERTREGRKFLFGLKRRSLHLDRLRHYLRGYAKSRQNNNRANSVLVGVIEAGMFLELTAQGAFPQAWIDETQKMLALKRWGKPEEIGYAVAYLASNRAAYVTGQQINVSGGFGI